MLQSLMFEITEATYYTFLGVRDDGSVPVVDLLECVNDAEALAQLQVWIYDHATCATAELWRGGTLVDVVRAPALGIDRKAS